ncbi:hypothetical protein PHAVU_006G022150 [Phaseolus vulgaris]|uniref:lysine-specific demethylase JMJ26-like n=1 Tax=Phaseolus vulgaris TaxID=3885 RepID=UPI0035C9F2A0
MAKEAIEESCPYSQGNCNCKACLRRGRADVNADSGVTQNADEKIRHLKHIVRALYPFLEQFNHEQQLEMEMEAKIKGLLLSDVEVNQIVCSEDERIYYNNCKTSIILIFIGASQIVPMIFALLVAGKCVAISYQGE